MPILDWLVRCHWPGERQGQFAYPSAAAGKSLRERLEMAWHNFGGDLLFVHRDAEKQPPDIRRKEIAQALQTTSLCYVPVVPVRMTEAWLLLDQRAIRLAAGNPVGSAELGLPPPREWERRTDPKRDLHAALIAATGASGRRRRKFNPAGRQERVAELTADFSPLRRLAAFRRLESDFQAALRELVDAAVQ